MGLDMYLNRKTYVKRWDFQKKADQFQVSVKLGGKKYEGIKPELVSYIIEEVGYWRKANQIHAWFERNLNDEEMDNGSEAYCSEEDLQSLLSDCREVLKDSQLVSGEIHNGYTYKNGQKVFNIEQGLVIKDPTTAKRLLPTEDGFFFGSQDYDQYYLDDIRHTVKVLEEALSVSGVEYYYSANW